MSNRLLQIDALTLPHHYYLDEQDICYYVGEYTAGRGHSYSPTNQLIHNFKKTMDKRGTPQWPYKERAIQQVANIFRTAIRLSTLITFVPIPPSRAKGDPLYDDRMLQLLHATWGGGQNADIRELVVQTVSLEAAHLANRRPRPEELIANYHIDESLAEPSPETICIVDDVLTSGCHFTAMKSILMQRYPQARIIGLFIARRVPESDDFDFDIIE